MRRKTIFKKNNQQLITACLQHDMQLSAALCFLKHKQKFLTYIYTSVQKD